MGDDPEDTAVFYVFHDYDNDQTLVVIVKYKGHSTRLVINDEDLGGTDGVRLAYNNMCGHAVDDQGWTQVYCIAEIPGFHLLNFPLDTTTPDALKSQLDNNGLFMESAELSANDLEGLGARSATFSLADKHLSLLIPSRTKKSFVFNANDKTLSLYGQEADVEWGTNVMYATEAYKKDMVNLGCNGGTGGGGTGGGTGGGSSSGNNDQVCIV